MKQSGAKLVEVGTTNRTHLDDFRSVIHDRTGMILRAHHSNFRIVGFTTEPTLEELVSLGEEFDVPVLDDIGSGALLDTRAFGLGHEPMVQESLQSGATLVAFSGDKLLGGPQAGILVGTKVVIKKLKKHPLARAVRPDKLCLAALTATLIPYLTGKAAEEIPVWRMIAAEESDIKSRANSWVDRLSQGKIRAGQSTVGGGSLPEETLPTWLVALTIDRPDTLATKLRRGDPAIISRVEDDHVVLDPRTVNPDDDERLLARLNQLLND
jgi:L-seryl-tRNA(Ser) seleniumtransferase